MKLKFIILERILKMVRNCGSLDVSELAQSATTGSNFTRNSNFPQKMRFLGKRLKIYQTWIFAKQARLLEKWFV